MSISSASSASMRPELSLDAILAVEDDPALLNFQCHQTGILLWPLARVPFIRVILSDVLYGTPLPMGRAATPKLQAVKTLGKAAIHNALHRSIEKTDILLMATGAGNQVKDGRWFNRLADHFALARPDNTLLVEDFFQWQWPFPRWNSRVLFHAPTQTMAILAGRLFCRDAHIEQAHALISLVEARARQLIDWELGANRKALLINALARKSAAVPWLYCTYCRMLGRVRPKILIKEEACYGPSSVLMHAARNMGVITAEYQHGAISAGHDAYNFSRTLRQSTQFQKSLPDYFFGYGSWWNEQVNAPVNKVTIGNPHRSEQLKRYPFDASRDTANILILGDGIETDFYLQLAGNLAAQIDPALSVVFRPHPLERTAVFKRFSDGADGAVRIDRNVDIYESFKDAYAVISELSTGLFEAVGLVQRIFILDTRKSRFAFPDHPFGVFTTIEDFLWQLREAHQGELNSEQCAKIWAPNWRENYQSFLEGISVK